MLLVCYCWLPKTISHNQQKKNIIFIGTSSRSSRSTSNNNSKSIKKRDLWNFKSAFNNSYKHYCSCVCRCIVLSAGTAEKSATIYNNKITCCYQQTEQWESYIHAPSWIPHIFKLLSCYHLHIKFYCLIYGWLMWCWYSLWYYRWESYLIYLLFLLLSHNSYHTLSISLAFSHLMVVLFVCAFMFKTRCSSSACNNNTFQY